MPDSPAALRPRVAFAMPTADLRDRLLPPPALARLAACAEILTPEPIRRWDDPAIASLLPDLTAVITGWGAPRVTPQLCDAAPGLRLVAHAAGTVRSVFDPACYARGVGVTTAAEANSWPVAQWTLAMIILAGKQVWPRSRWFAEQHAAPSSAIGPTRIGNHGLTVGIIGASRIGRLVLPLLRPHGYRVLLADPTVGPDEARDLGAELVELPALMAGSDVVSLHAPILPSTIGMITTELIASMRDGATFINSARGVLVDHDGLREHCATGRIQAVLDVTDPEPLPADDPLWRMPTVWLTPHVAGSQGRELALLGESAVAEIEALAAGRPPIHPVTAQAYEGAA